MEAVRKRYPGNDDLNTDNQRYNLTTSYNTERSIWQLTGSRSELSTISEMQITPNTAVVGVPVKYDIYSINPSWTWVVDELTRLQLSYSVSGYSYVNGQTVGLYDYSARTITAQLTKQIDPKNSVFFSGGYSSFNVPSTSYSSKGGSYQVGITRSFSETMNGTLSAGLRKMSDEQDVAVCTLFFGPVCLQTRQEMQSTDHTSSVFGGSLKKQFETVRVSLNVSRAYDPSGQGTIVRTDSQNAELTKRLTENLSGNVSVNNYSYKSESANVTNIGRRYYILASGLSWRWTPELNVNFLYQYGHIKRDSENEPATSNSAILFLEYQWPQMTFSR